MVCFSLPSAECCGENLSQRDKREAMRVSAGSRQPAVPGANTRLRREVLSGCLMKGLLRLISASRGLLCELACFERYVAHYAGIVGSRFKRSHMIHIGAARCVCQGKLPPFPPWLGVNSAEGHRGHKICLLLHFTGRKIRCL